MIDRSVLSRVELFDVRGKISICLFGMRRTTHGSCYRDSVHVQLEQQHPREPSSKGFDSWLCFIM